MGLDRRHPYQERVGAGYRAMIGRAYVLLSADAGGTCRPATRSADPLNSQGAVSARTGQHLDDQPSVDTDAHLPLRMGVAVVRKPGNPGSQRTRQTASYKYGGPSAAAVTEKEASASRTR